MHIYFIGEVFFIKDSVLTIRTKGEFDNILREEAKTRGVSLNSLINHIFEKHIVTYRFVDSFPCLIIPSQIVKELIDGTSEKHLIDVATFAGSVIPKESLFLSGLTKNLDNVLFCMEKKVGRYSNWYQLECDYRDDSVSLLLRHNLGRKWSIFLSSYYSMLFKEMLNISIRTEIENNSVTIIFQKPIEHNNIFSDGPL
jgi:hypothetical protein